MWIGHVLFRSGCDAALDIASYSHYQGSRNQD
jgi:hypothetical protein